MLKAFRDNRRFFVKGMRDAIPIGLGYFAVAFSLGIAAKNAGLSPFQGFLLSFLENASAGEFAGIVLIAANASYFEVALMTFIANARYFLMSCSLSQKLRPNTALHHRMLIGFDITDEIFGISIAQEGYLNPFYSYGAMLSSIPYWATGTMLGIIAGNILPIRMVSALSVALYGMFLAVIIPPIKKNKIIGGLVAVSFGASYMFSHFPPVSALSDGTRTIILTVLISAAVSTIFPLKKGESESEA